MFINWKEPFWAVRDENNHRKLLNYRTYIALINPVFRVSANGREYMRKTGRGNLHAGIIGDVLAYHHVAEAGFDGNFALEYLGSFEPYVKQGRTICYRPLIDDCFVFQGTKESVVKADLVLFDGVKRTVRVYTKDPLR